MRLFISVFAFALSFGSVSAQSLDSAREALQNFDYQTAFDEFSALADMGEAQAILALGRMYREGQGVDQDYVAARTLFEQALALGEVSAANDLGVLYFNGQGVERDIVEGNRLFRVAHEGGVVSGTVNLAMSMIRGEGMAADPVQGLELLEDAAASGHGGAMFQLGAAQFDGDIVEQDYDSAYQLFSASVSSGGFPVEWVALRNLYFGISYTHGFGTEVDPEQAFFHFSLCSRSSPTGIAQCQEALGSSYLFGEGTDRDLERALLWLHIAAEQGRDTAERVQSLRVALNPTAVDRVVMEAIRCLSEQSMLGCGADL